MARIGRPYTYSIIKPSMLLIKWNKAVLVVRLSWPNGHNGIVRPRADADLYDVVISVLTLIKNLTP